MTKNTRKVSINYYSVFDATPALMLILAPDLTILDANKAYLTATLTNRNEIINQNIFEVFPDNPNQPKDNSVKNLRNSLETVLRTGKSDTMPLQKYDIPIPASSNNGFEEKYWNPKNTPVFDEENRLVYIIHQVEDVTTSLVRERTMTDNVRKSDALIRQKSLRIQKNAVRIHAILEALLKYTKMDFSVRLTVSEEGDELDAIAMGLNALIEELEHHTKLLSETNKELEYSNKELDSFSYSVSHDLRAPLRAINAYSQILLEDSNEQLDEAGKKHLGVIIRNATKMGMLIDDLLTFSRVGKQNLIKVQLDMNKHAQIVIEELKPQFPHVNATINLLPLEDARGDMSMLVQVLTNLISNAIKYSSFKKNPEIEIGSYREKKKIVYYVKDNGSGFDMKYYDKLFGVFQRLHSSSKFEGTGVGLALVKRIVKKHKGEVWAEAKVDEGATFFFSLPINSSKN